MFGKLRRKFNSVIQDGLTLSENLSNSYLKSPSPSFEVNKAEYGIPSDVNLNAGCNLLQKNEDTWKDMHEMNEKNAMTASSIDKSITRIKDSTAKTYVDLTDLNVCLASLPKIEDELNKCMEMISNIGSQCQNFDMKLVELEDLMEEASLQENQLQHKFQMSMYKQKKMKELEEVRTRLATEHDENVRKYESELRKIQMERQAVFQDAFQKDVEMFMEKGVVPKVDHISKKATEVEVTLEEIVLDDADNNNDLENFLKD
uniref:Putative dysbindin protein isoform x1 n=1 Tax=Tabanus bromius TaxID=304241 RepID=A0A0K8TQJ6_TABBR